MLGWNCWFFSRVEKFMIWSLPLDNFNRVFFLNFSIVNWCNKWQLLVGLQQMTANLGKIRNLCHRITNYLTSLYFVCGITNHLVSFYFVYGITSYLVSCYFLSIAMCVCACTCARVRACALTQALGYMIIKISISLIEIELS